MSYPSDLSIYDDDEDIGEIFLDEFDIIHEVPSDDDEQFSDADDDDDSLHTFTGHTGEELFSVACSPRDTTLVATGGRDHKGFLWRIGQGDGTSELNGHTETVSSLAFSYDGTFLASGDLNGNVKVWNEFGHLKGSLKGPGGIEWLRWHPRGNILLAAGSEDCNVRMWDADNSTFGKRFSGHQKRVTCGDFTPDGNTICTGSDDATLIIWNRITGEKIHAVQGPTYHTEGLTCLSISSTSTVALTGSEDGSVHIVNITTGRVVNTLASHSKSVECVGFAPSGSWAAVGSLDKKMVIWDIEHSLARSTCVHKDGVLCLAWLGTSPYVATGCEGGVVRLWDSRSDECVRTFRGHSDAIQSLAFSANGDHLVSASSDGTARVFEVKGFC